MKPQFGVCKNKVGCSFAYTGEKIPVPPDSKCPECGQPLALDSSRKSSAKILIALGLLLLLILIGGGAALFAFKDQIFHLAFNKQETSQKVVEAQGEDKLASATPAQGQESSVPPSNSPSNASTPDSSSSSEDKVVIAPTETPTPLPSASPRNRPSSAPRVKAESPRLPYRSTLARTACTNMHTYASSASCSASSASRRQRPRPRPRRGLSRGGLWTR